MKATRMLVPLVVLLLAFSACAPRGDQDSVVQPFIGGNVALDIGLMEGAPPASIMDAASDGVARQEFGYGVVLTNVGEADVGGSRNPFLLVTLEGFLPSVFGTTPANLRETLPPDYVLQGARKNFDGTVIRGGIANFMFEPLGYTQKLQGDTVVNFLTNICYDYENWATVPLCFKSDIQETVQDAQICTLRGEKLPSNSGGPIQVVSLVQQPIDPYRVMVNLVVEHVGTGEVYGRPSLTGAAEEECDPSSMNFNKNKVYVEVSSQDPAVAIQCSSLGGDNAGLLTLYQGSPATLTCTVNGDANTGQRAYTDLLTVNLRYRYGESVLQPIVVQALGER